MCCDNIRSCTSEALCRAHRIASKSGSLVKGGRAHIRTRQAPGCPQLRAYSCRPPVTRNSQERVTRTG
jgi:hypothetical protein